MAVADPSRLTPHACSGLLAPYDSWPHRIAVYHFVKDIPATPRHRTWSTLEQIEQGLPTLADRPVLMIWGMRDWCFTPVCLERLQRSFPHAEVECYDDVGHWVLEEASQRSIDRLRPFLAAQADS
jgi:haloalkane dehalogenase